MSGHPVHTPCRCTRMSQEIPGTQPLRGVFSFKPCPSVTERVRERVARPPVLHKYESVQRTVPLRTPFGTRQHVDSGKDKSPKPVFRIRTPGPREAFRKNSDAQGIDVVTPSVLVVEDSQVFGGLIQKRIQAELKFDVHWVRTYKETLDLLETRKPDYLLALLDLHLPDAPMGEIIDFVLAKGIPSVVFTGSFGETMRDTIWSYKVVDYIPKETIHNVDYIVSLVRRIHRNRYIHVLVADNARESRRHLADLLKVHQYLVHEASNGEEALSLLSLYPDIKLVITEYDMPRMDGFTLTSEIRDRYAKSDLAIIGMSTQGNNILSARFIKNGANDFITKPFVTEEFYCRITQNIEMVEHMAAVRESSNRDYLTGLYNRRYLFESGRALHASALRGHIQVTVGMIDIDHFKTINDTYGHDAGDAILREVAAILESRFRESDLVARVGGEEFCVIAVNMDRSRIQEIFEHLRETVAHTLIRVREHTIRNTVSIGVCTTLMRTLDSMMKQADDMLYEAKAAGRNTVRVSTEEHEA